MSKQDLLRVENLSTYIYTPAGVVRAVDDVSFEISQDETVGIVGETGSGKSMCAYSILQLIPPAAKIVKGRILFHGADLAKQKEGEVRKLRGDKISIVFQEPFSYLNPLMRVGQQISEVLIRHDKAENKSAKELVIGLLNQVEMPKPDEVYFSYPHQLSGGMQQRILIAMAIACKPELIVADEPTTALDVTVQLEILHLLRKLRAEFKMSMLLITHDLGVASEMCDRIYVMYAGKIVESGSMTDVLRSPRHPYAALLSQSALSIYEGKLQLASIPGNVPSLLNPPMGCRFHPRCPYKIQRCTEVEPEPSIEGNRIWRCWVPLESNKT